MGYPNYVWIIPGWYPEQLSVQESLSGFTRDEPEAFLRGVIEITNNPINMEENVITISGKVSRFMFL